MSEDPRLRFRIWVDARLVDEAWVDVTASGAEAAAEAIQARHGKIAYEAARDQRPWMVEAYDPDKPEEEAYMRVGTDANGMIDPRVIW